MPAPRSSTRLAAVVSLLTFLSVPARAGVDILGRPNLGTFAEIQPAVDAARDGDVLVVGSGTYAGFVVTNKALTIARAPGGSVTIYSGSRILDLGPHRRVSLLGLKLSPGDDNQGVGTPGLLLRDNQGRVRLQDCTFKGAYGDQGSMFQPAGAAVEALRCASVLLLRCQLQGGNCWPQPGEATRHGGDGLLSIDSAVALYECSLRGGEGSFESSPAGGDGGAGCRVLGWGVFAMASAFRGGIGREGDYLWCTAGGDGGDGLFASEAQAQLFDTTLLGGPTLAWKACIPASPGSPLVAAGSVVNQTSTLFRRLSVPTDASDGSSIPITVNGAPGERVWLIVGDGSAFLYSAASQGVAVNPQPWAPIDLGVIGPSGVLTAPFVIPDLTSPRPAWLWTFQALCVDAAGGTKLTSSVLSLVRNL